VRYVLEGSVRKGGNRIRVTAQLIDATTGLHVWAERYDRELEGIFDLQDEITRTIVARIEPEISAAERNRAIHRRTDNLGAWECYQRGLAYMWEYGREEHDKALEMLTRATELDPNFSTAFAYLCYAYYEGVVMGWPGDPYRQPRPRRLFRHRTNLHDERPARRLDCRAEEIDRTQPQLQPGLSRAEHDAGDGRPAR